MKKMFVRVTCLMIFCCCVCSGLSFSQPVNQSKKEINKWFKERNWLNGLQLSPHKSVNREEFAKQYAAKKQWWDTAFAYLKETDLVNLKPGRYEIMGNDVFALVTEGPTKDKDKTKWEAHRVYQDIHYVIRGKEKIGITPVSSATVTEEYDAARDIGFYSSKGKFYESDPGKFIMAFPSDAHRPGVKARGHDSVKKVVIKIRKAD